MRRNVLVAAACLTAVLAGSGTAHAESPILGPASAIDIDGVSALLRGSVDPRGLPTTYHFEYVSQAQFTSSGFGAASSTPAGSLEPGPYPHPATGFASALQPDTVYRYRLVAANASGTTSAPPLQFQTTDGFGFLDGAAGFGVQLGGGATLAAGSHPDFSISLGFNPAGEFEGELPPSVDVFGPASPARQYEFPLTESDGSTPFPFSKPIALTTDPSANVWVSDPGGKAVEKFDPSGAFVVRHTGAPFVSGGVGLEGEAYSAAANELLIADSGRHFWGIGPDAVSSGRSFGFEGPGPLQLAFDNSGGESDGDRYVFTGRAVVRTTGTGASAPFTAGPAEGSNRLIGIDTTPTGTFAGPGRPSRGGIAVDAAGNLYVADGTRHLVAVFASTGALLRTIRGTASDPLEDLTAIAVDPTDGYILLAEPTVVKELSSSGQAMGAIAEAGGRPLADVRALAVDGSGRLYVADAGASPVFPDGDVRDVHIEAPPGLIAIPNDVAKCSLLEFNTPRRSPYEKSRSGENCTKNAQVGTVELSTSLNKGRPRTFGIFNLQPPPGAAAEIGFAPYGAHIAFRIELRPDANGTYIMTLDAVNVPQDLDISGMELSLWGAPSEPGHNGERGNCLNEEDPGNSWAGEWWITPEEKSKGQRPCSGTISTLRTVPKSPGEKSEPCFVESPTCKPLGSSGAYLTAPHRCSGQLEFTATADAWQQPSEVSTSAVDREANGQPVEMVCQGVPFGPKAEGLLTETKASSRAASSSGSTRMKAISRPPAVRLRRR
jgi:hypothetical protein